MVFRPAEGLRLAVGLGLRGFAVFIRATLQESGIEVHVSNKLEKFQKEMGRDLHFRPWFDHSSSEEIFWPVAEWQTAQAPPSYAFALLDVGAVCRGRSVDATIGFGGIEGNELDGDGCCGHRAFVSNDVHVVVTGINERRRRLSGDKSVHVGRAVVFVLRYGSRRDNDQTVAWMRVPAGSCYRSCRQVDGRPEI